MRYLTRYENSVLVIIAIAHKVALKFPFGKSEIGRNDGFEKQLGNFIKDLDVAIHFAKFLQNRK